jgi:hypothetical protein
MLNEKHLIREKKMSRGVIVNHSFLEDKGKAFDCNPLSQSIYSVLCNFSYNEFCFEEYSDMITVNEIGKLFPSESILDIRKSLQELHNFNLIHFLNEMVIDVSNGKGDAVSLVEELKLEKI